LFTKRSYSVDASKDDTELQFGINHNKKQKALKITKQQTLLSYDTHSIENDAFNNSIVESILNDEGM
jgi:hypothetical protein